VSDVAEAIEEAGASLEGPDDRASDAPAVGPSTSAPMRDASDLPTDRPPASPPMADGEASDLPTDRPPASAPTTDGEALPLPGIVEALLFLSSDPLSPGELAEAAGTSEVAVLSALGVLAEEYAPGRRGIRLRELGGGFTLASDPASEDAARRLFSRPRVSTLTPAQAETLAIVAYLQPVSRPEITRIRGVSADSAAATLLDRGLIEEAGHSQFGAILYRTSTQFLKLFGLRTLEELPDVARWDPTPEEQAELRDRLLRAGEARLGGGAGNVDGP
jgi:segregation and condensation protein B